MIRAKNRNGQRIARLFRQVRGMSTGVRACDLDRILVEDEIDVSESFCSEPGYTACLMKVDPKIPPGILLAPGQGRGRRRFSIAHELGHHYIPTHSRMELGWCGEDAMTAGPDSSARLEWEANDFAAELLMPRSRFAQDVGTRDPAFRTATELAAPECYDVSITAAALRLVDVTSQRCALVCAREERIEWVARSEAFFYRIPGRGDRLPPGSMGALSIRDGPVDHAEPLDPYTWLEVTQMESVELFESTHSVPSQGQVLSLVWVVPEDAEYELD